MMFALTGSNSGLEFLLAAGFVVGLAVALLGKR